uniref:Uncharacterized protein n=1 Tax=Candidatus Kentrum sp. TC TaxID=2126339 RepID=A0A450Y8L6_9GAMM|nr:MAG: hypothetical protein BECKTC1821E_GA0114239_1001126 [Candidatus Kentron sp. TC]
MIHHSRRTDIHEAIDTGISLLDNLFHHPTRILEKAFKDTALHRVLSPHHIGILAPSSSHGDLSIAIEGRGLEVLSVFPSAVVTAQLTQCFGKRVSVDIYLCRPMTDHVDDFTTGHDKVGACPKMEIFRVVDGLTAEDIRAAMSDVLHVAYTPRQPTDTATISQKMLVEGFEYVGGGINSNEPMSEENAITVLYFRKRQPIEGIPKIEFFLPGKHALPPVPGTADPSKRSFNDPTLW